MNSAQTNPSSPMADGRHLIYDADGRYVIYDVGHGASAEDLKAFFSSLKGNKVTK